MSNYLAIFMSHNILLTAMLAFGLGMWVYFDRRSDARNVTLGAMLVAVSFWSFSFVLWRVSHDDRQGLFWVRTVFFIGTLLPALYFFFAYSLLREKLPSMLVQALIFVPNIVFLWVAYGSSLLVLPGSTSDVPIIGVGRTIFGVHFAVTIIAALVLMLLASRRNTSLDKNKLASVLVGTIIAFDSIFAVLFGAKLTSSADAFWVGNVALMAGMFVIAISIIRSKLLVDLRMVSVEVFILLTLFVIIADIVVSQSILDFTLRLAILIVLVFYGALTSRNMVKEAHHLRELQALTDHVTAMNGRLLEADRTKTQFVSLASHQFRAPLGGMRSYLDMLYKGNFGQLNSKQQEIVQLNLGVCNQLLETIETFLNVTKIELGKLELYKSETAFQQLVPRVVESVAPLADRKKIAVEADVPQFLQPIMCDSGKLYHVLMNLIDNAIKYTEQGKIRVSVHAEDGRLSVAVKDTGIGLSKEEQQKLFKGFQRGLSGIELNKDGSGLGLFIVKNIVEAHGGGVFVDSEGKGKGSTFGFWIPAQQP